MLGIAAPGVLNHDTDEGSADTLNAVLINDPASGVVALNDDGSFSYTPHANFNGRDSFTYQVQDDDGGLSEPATVSIMVHAVNDAPVLNAIGDQEVDEGDTLRFTATATDIDVPAETLVFSLDADAPPAGAVIHPNTGEFSWTPSAEQRPGIYSITVRVTDNGAPVLDDFETISVTVNEDDVVPIAYWNLNETSGRTVGDRAGAPQNGRFFGPNPDLDDSGPPASVAPFGAQTGADFHDTTCEYIAVANDAALQVAEGSIQLWFKTRDASDKQALFAKDRSGRGSGELLIWLDDRDLKVKLETGGTVRTIDTDCTAYDNLIRSNKWYQLTFTFGPGGMKLYLDGNLVGSNSDTGGLTLNAQPIVIGASNATNRNDSGDLSRIMITDPFDGYIDEVAFFATALSADQIKQSRQGGAMGVGEDLLPGAAPSPLLLAGQTQPVPSPVTPNARLAREPVTIDWTRQCTPAPRPLQQAARWAAEFVNCLGSSEGERNPNDALRLTLPTKIAKRL